MTYQLHPIHNNDNAHVRAVNPYEKHTSGLAPLYVDGKWKTFDHDNQPLPLFHPDNTPVSVKEAREEYQDSEVDVVWQYKIPALSGYFWAAVPNHCTESELPTRTVCRLKAENVFHEVQKEFKAAIKGVTGKTFDYAEPRQQDGLKRDIIDLVLNLAAPDDDCMLSDFLGCLQFVLDKHNFKTNS